MEEMTESKGVNVTDRITSRFAGKEFRASNKYYFTANDIGSCPRSLCFEMMGMEKTESFSKNRERIFEVGRTLESQLRNWIMDAGLHVPCNRRHRRDSVTYMDALGNRVTVPIRISYEIDMVFRDPMSAEKIEDMIIVPIECKTSWNEKFRTRYSYTCPECSGIGAWNTKKCKHCGKYIEILKLPSNFGYNDGYFYQHYFQLMTYIMDNDFPYGYIVYIDRVFGDDVWHRIERDEVVWKQMIERCLKIEEMVKEGKIPKARYSETSYACKYCDYTDACMRANMDR